MAKMDSTRMEVFLNQQDRRLLRNLTKAIDRLARSKWEETAGASGVKWHNRGVNPMDVESPKRLSEPVWPDVEESFDPEKYKRPVHGNRG